MLWKCGFISAFSSNLPLALLQFIKSHICLQLYGLDEQPGSIQNFFLQRETSLTGLKCEGGGKSFPLVLLNIIFSQETSPPFHSPWPRLSHGCPLTEQL